jgi:opacity protein-like surface antigen
MNRILLLSVLLFSVGASAQKREEDGPEAYDDGAGDEDVSGGKRKTKSLKKTFREEDESEAAGEESMASLDDPNIGLSGELLAGMMLLEAPRGGAVDIRFGGGLRFTWEFGRLLSDEYLREMFFADVTWIFSGGKDGTKQFFTDQYLHYFTLAPAFALPIKNTPIAAYGQVGVGFNYGITSLTYDNNITLLATNRLVFQYGAGLRFRIPLTDDKKFRLSFRLEFTRLVRSYLQDTMIGGSVGMTF